jgi:hypothetical protein
MKEGYQRHQQRGGQTEETLRSKSEDLIFKELGCSGEDNKRAFFVT